MTFQYSPGNVSDAWFPKHSIPSCYYPAIMLNFIHGLRYTVCIQAAQQSLVRCTGTLIGGDASDDYTDIQPKISIDEISLLWLFCGC